MRWITITIAALGLLAACGFNGTDADGQSGETAPAAVKQEDPDFAAFEEAEIADPEPRPVMQAQVVLDARGFGPGVIDGGLGLSTRNALKGFQEANGLEVTGELDEATKQALARWEEVPATRVVRIPESWGRIAYREVPEEPEDQAKLERLGYASLDEKLAERFHTTVEMLQELNPGGRPAGMKAEPSRTAGGEAGGQRPGPGTGETSASPTSTGAGEPPAMFRAGQWVRVPNIGGGRTEPDVTDEDGWARTLASLGVDGEQPDAASIVVDKSEGTLRAFDENDKLIALFTVTTGSQHDPLPLGEWKILGVSRNPPFHYDPDLFWDAEADDEKTRLPPGPNGPVGVAWIDLSKEHYGIHGTPEPQTIGRAQSHGCVRLTNWDVARIAEMVSGATKVIFQA